MRSLSQANVHRIMHMHTRAIHLCSLGSSPVFFLTTPECILSTPAILGIQGICFSDHSCGLDLGQDDKSSPEVRVSKIYVQVPSKKQHGICTEPLHILLWSLNHL